jgi:hypothetical protein
VEARQQRPKHGRLGRGHVTLGPPHALRGLGERDPGAALAVTRGFLCLGSAAASAVARSHGRRGFCFRSGMPAGPQHPSYPHPLPAAVTGLTTERQRPRRPVGAGPEAAAGARPELWPPLVCRRAHNAAGSASGCVRSTPILVRWVSSRGQSIGTGVALAHQPRLHHALAPRLHLCIILPATLLLPRLRHAHRPRRGCEPQLAGSLLL